MPAATLTVSNLPDLISVLGALFGFHIHNSFVAIEVKEPKRELGFRLRIDIPAIEDAEICAEIIAGHLVNNGATTVVLAIVGPRSDASEALMFAAHQQCVRQAITVLAAGRGDGQHCWFYDAEGKPTTQREIYDATTSPLLVEAVVAGVHVYSSRAEYAQLLAPVEGRARALVVHRQQLLLAALGSRLSNTDEAISNARRLRRCGGAITHSEIVELCIWLSNDAARDALWLSMDRASAFVDWEFWSSVARVVVPPYEQNVLMLAGFAAWMRGDGTSARIAIERSLAVDPQHRASVLLARALDYGMSPDCWEEIKNQGLLAR